MVIRLPGRRSIEVHWLADGAWQWRIRRGPFPPHWLYWGRFAVCLSGAPARRRPSWRPHPVAVA